MAFVSGVSVDGNFGDVKTEEKVAIISGVGPMFCGRFGSRCVKNVCDHRGCNEIGSVEKASKDKKGEVNEVSATPGWEKIRIQVDSGAIDTVGPKRWREHSE